MANIRYPYEFDSRKRKVAKSYRRGKLLFYFLGLLISLGTAMFILGSGLNISIRNLVLQYPLPTLLYGFITLLIFSVTGFPLTFYSNYVYDHKFKLSRYTVPSWLRDYAKINLIYYILSLTIISVLYFSISTFSPWWFYAGVFYIVFSTTINYIYPLIIVPFMWKTEPYRDQRMKEKILNLCRKLNVMNIRNVVVIKESEKSIRPNAVFMGFGNSKRIGLFDTLLSSFAKDEIETVVGHELGHYVNRDIIRSMILEALLIFPMLFIVDYFVKMFAPIFGIQGLSDLAALPLIGLVFGFLGFLLMPLSNTHSRWRESKADEFALEHVKKPIVQISTEKRLADLHLSELKTHPLIEFWLFSHPSTIKRIKMAEKWKEKLNKS